MSVNTCAGHANLLCTEMLRATCSADVHRCRPDSNDTKDTRVSAGSRRTTYRDQKNVCSRQKLPPRVPLDAPKPDTRTACNKEKHGQHEILESRDIRQVPNKRRVEVQSQNRDMLIRDVCTCLARPKTFSRSLTTLKRHVDVIRISCA